jgi:hypothetical protein
VLIVAFFTAGLILSCGSSSRFSEGISELNFSTNRSYFIVFVALGVFEEAYLLRYSKT